ncbi:MAG: hypothetical protein Ct9H90mP6_06400 [Gammaproteobacteria bacterium]|nr:MAG: hypothetical protein Ct9H90mP6_06400 [Gammaproteobacteria bacterium]
MNWPCIRINLDSHVSRLDLLGKDAIKLEDGKQITKFVEGILPGQFKILLLLFSMSMMLEDQMLCLSSKEFWKLRGKLTLLDQNRVLRPTQTLGFLQLQIQLEWAIQQGLYHGTQQINQGQMDRWHILSTLNYLTPEHESKLVLGKLKGFNSAKRKLILSNMIKLCNLTRQGFINGDISNLMSPRTLLTWAENFIIFKDIHESFKLSFLNKCDDLEKPIVAEYFQRCFAEELEVENS